MRRPARFDAGLYAASAVVAAGTWFLADIPIHRTWGRIAVGPYAAGTLLMLGVALLGRPSRRARDWIAVGVFAGVALLPMALEVAWRARTEPGLHAQSEVIVTEEAAKALVHGKNPYDVDYLDGPLRARPLGTKTHFTYLPGMLAFGLPRAVAGSSAVTDARIAFAVVTLVVAGFALWGRRERGVGEGRGWDPERRLRALQVFLLLPTGALLMATSGDDLPVLGLMLLAIALAERGSTLGAGVALGLAAATKQTAWVLVPFLILALRDRAWRRGTAAAAAVVVPVVLPFLLWRPGAFIEDVIEFPIGLGRQRSAAETPTVGSWLVRTFPSARVPLTAMLVAAIASVLVVMLLRPGVRTPSEAARSAGLVFIVALVLAPAGRIGYLVYPLNLLAWSWLRERSAASMSPDPSEAAGSRRLIGQQ
jgi:Glycosyltransferase family 87